MWDEISIQYCEAIDIAEALYKGEVSLQELKSLYNFQTKEDQTEEGFWNLCENDNKYQKYIEIYPEGKHISEAEEKIWNSAVSQGDMNGYISYIECFPSGKYAVVADDKVWELALVNFSFSAYLHFFPKGRHADDARKYQADEDAWTKAKETDKIDGYELYIETYPNGLHVSEANECLERLRKIIGGQRKLDMIRILANDRNAYPLNYIKAMGITAEDLMGKIRDSRGNVSDGIFASWDDVPRDLSMGNTPDSIEPGRTEVYFWGVPGSGKTCAMAAILSTARRMGAFQPGAGAGLGYMNDLSGIFIPARGKSAVSLPRASSVDTTQYLPLTLNEKMKGTTEEIQQHDLAVVEISGEIFRCFSCEFEGRPFPSREHEQTYNQLKKYLNDKENPKYHFFILDSKPLNDADQERVLQNAAAYFQRTRIFNDKTQGISLIVTKSDVLSPDRSKWRKCAEDAANEYFSSLVNQLKIIVGNKKNGGLGLSNGTLKVIPLSIGEVFFQSLCVFDPEPARVLVNLLIEYSTVSGKNGSRWRWLLSK